MKDLLSPKVDESGRLNQIYGSGAGRVAFAIAEGAAYRLSHRLVACKDYLNDALWVARQPSPTATILCYGFKVTKNTMEFDPTNPCVVLVPPDSYKEDSETPPNETWAARAKTALDLLQTFEKRWAWRRSSMEFAKTEAASVPAAVYKLNPLWLVCNFVQSFAISVLRLGVSWDKSKDPSAGLLFSGNVNGLLKQTDFMRTSDLARFHAVHPAFKENWARNWHPKNIRDQSECAFPPGADTGFVHSNGWYGMLDLVRISKQHPEHFKNFNHNGCYLLKNDNPYGKKLINYFQGMLK